MIDIRVSYMQDLVNSSGIVLIPKSRGIPASRARDESKAACVEPYTRLPHFHDIFMSLKPRYNHSKLLGLNFHLGITY